MFIFRYFLKSSIAKGSPAAISLSGVVMKRLSHVRSRTLVIPARSGPIFSPWPMVWHAAHCVAKIYRPLFSILIDATSAYVVAGVLDVVALAVFQLSSQPPIILARKRALS